MVPGETRLLFRNDASTPLGRLTTAGLIRQSRGVGASEARILGSYAIVYLLDGSGRYWDARHEQSVHAGDLLLIFPEIEHRYGPRSGEYWDEFYLVFDGPAFDLCRQPGLLDPADPIRHLEPIERWLSRMEAIVAPPDLPTIAGRTQRVLQLVALLTEMMASGSHLPQTNLPPVWLSAACAALEADLGQPLEPQQVAEQLGLSYETFRKRFQQHMGVAPARYRSTRRIDAACALLQHPTRTIAAIAAELGFSDEFHFSRRFKQITGMAPREFRRRLPRTNRYADLPENG
jgi:AraC-like DNA-binding protein